VNAAFAIAGKSMPCADSSTICAWWLTLPSGCHRHATGVREGQVMTTTGNKERGR
jgi:hypothetical protein